MNPNQNRPETQITRLVTTPVHRLRQSAAGFLPAARLWLAFVLLLSVFFTAGRAVAAERKVPDDYRTITEALAVANDDDTIRVAAGTYSVDTGEILPLRLDKVVVLQGDPNNKPHLKGDGKHTVVLIETGGVTLRGFQITGGKGSEGINSMDGGGVCVFVSPGETNAVTIEDCNIADNNCPSDETYDGCGGGIYCGGTYCECFEVRIYDCNIVDNDVNGCGGGVFCALLSNVDINDTRIENNTADDHGGGVFVDVFALLDINNTDVAGNNCPGDPQKPDWGGKGGGLACESYGLFTIKDCNFSKNTATYFGGGIFTRAGLFTTELACGGTAGYCSISGSRIKENRADVSGGGVYLAGSAILKCSNTTFYWNDAKQDGGAIFVADRATDQGIEDINMVDCLLEGNECAGKGGGVYLGQDANGVFTGVSKPTRFLGNSALFDGGAVFLEAGSTAAFSNCLMTYNNSARGYGGGIRAMQQSSIELGHCSIIGNFAPHKRSGLYLDPNATVSVIDSILWRNAGGSVEDSGATVDIATSLNEDEPDAPDPGYVGWGSLKMIYVSALASSPGIGTLFKPYHDLQLALDGFKFHLAADSPCIGTASDGGNMGADTGVDDVNTAGNIAVPLFIGPGSYDIRGRNIIFTRGIQGTDPNLSIIRHAVFGYIENAFITNLGITGEEMFGGITVRADVNFINCNVTSNTALADGGGIYVADGNCVLTNTFVSANNASANGGGIYLWPQTGLELTSSHIEHNAAAQGGGCFASSWTSNFVKESIIGTNSSSGSGAGFYLDVNSVSSLLSSQVMTNTSHNSGGGIYVAGRLDIHDVNFISNIVDAGENRGGAINMDRTGDVAIFRCVFSANRVGGNGGAINTHGKLEIRNSEFESNSGGYGGAIHFWEEPAGSGYCFESQFRKNNAYHGGAINAYVYMAPIFTNCEFIENTAAYGGAGICWWASHPTFDHCRFKANVGSAQGGSLYLCSTSSRFFSCTFNKSSSAQEGGLAYFRESDASLFEDCYVEKSSAGTSGGAFCITNAAQPVFSQVEILSSLATNYGGGIAIFEAAKPMFADVSISDCNAVYGGGVYAGGQSKSIFQQCEFKNNRAYELTTSADGGGAFFTENAIGWFTRCVFQDNTAQDDGGGMAIAENAKVDLRNTLFASNMAIDDGGGMHFTSQAAGTLRNCTLTLNKSIQGATGGGIYLEAESTVKIDSSIIWQNTPDGIRRQANPGVNYCCVQEVWPGTGNIVSDPLLEPVTYALRDGSPCIDAGNRFAGFNDRCRPPGKGGVRNDMGITGGPDNCVVVSRDQFNFNTFSDPAFLVLRGSAAFKDGALRLTEAQYRQAGGTWYAFPVDVQRGFETTFDFKIDRDGADGFAFVVQNYSLMALGSAGDYLGYNIPNSLAVEWDTSTSRGRNPVSVQTRGTQTNSPDLQYSLGSTTSVPFLSDNKPHTIKIVYVAGRLDVFVDNMERAVLTVTVDLETKLSLTDGRAFVGFTAATGGAIETHDILSWSFASAGRPEGDIDSDSNVDLSDYALFAEQWRAVDPIIISKDADLDNNGHVDFRDLSILLANWLQE